MTNTLSTNLLRELNSKLVAEITEIREKYSEVETENTYRARKIHELFEKIGVDKIKNIKTYSANSISELSDILLTDLSEIEVSEKVEKTLPETEAHILTTPVPLTHISNSEDKTGVSISEESISNEPESINAFDEDLPDDPKEKQKHVIKMALECFPVLSLKYSNESGDYFTCSEICSICNKDHIKENIGFNVEGIWSSGDYINTKIYSLKCWKAYQNSIQIISIKA
ncbi:hypothetical protein Glove_461g77 [Diversispora epigaea]|uniref:Uncharacterized protein n=1 Tax=Diversispora epigaea TaxID=1348612 RepID=A0A397GTQ4_9GLOM|nr:hypothetical protein Glove_461g77 [Diversispora epigaea]